MSMGDAELRTAAVREEAKVAGLNMRIQRAIYRAYWGGWVSTAKPLEQLSDRDLLRIPNIGNKFLVEIRSVIPAPAVPSGEDRALCER